MNKQYDVVIVGGGPAGINAAIAAGRMNVTVLLVERYGFLGGMSTAAMVYPWMTFHDYKGRQVIKGIAEEIVGRLQEQGASPGHLRDTIGFVRTVTPYKQEEYKLLALEMAKEAGVDILLHSFVDEVKVSGNSIESIVLSTKSGRMTIEGKTFIDCTGDGDLCHLAGAKMQVGRVDDGLTQPMTMKFRMNGVDLDAVKKYMIDHPDEFYSKSLIEEIKSGVHPLTVVQGFYPQWKKAGLPINRDHVLFFTGPGEDEVLINCSRVQGYDGTKAEDLTKAEFEGRKQVFMLAEFFKEYVPGFEKAGIASIAPQIGVRETRRILGEYVLTAEDVTNGTKFEDRIAMSAYPIDIHDPKKDYVTFAEVGGDGTFDIPYRCLLPKEIENVLAAGRCISTTHEAFATTRLTPSAMATGQAAGTAASIAVKEGVRPKDINISSLQKILKDNDVILD
ncbi:FAD-dependent oxidoreductase [Falsibacillus pallidus]|uniref:FAD dependent oxidoreductase n=1 Tax=Falsibacillus pallidus TaxID=493781 RepID=A0A370GAE0_9BACI|nr:FAD-dependent oxidoreductase [Falsibacillus pallidus]RDI39999.1 FAD dependent oxidoreductase [Falsibacillus pallidus]